METINKTFIVYPNPANDKIHIYPPLHNPIKVTIKQQNGKPVQTTLLNSSTLNIADLPEGIYAIEINQNEEILSSHFIKIRS